MGKGLRKNIPSSSKRAIEEILFPMTILLAPDVTKSKTAVKLSSNSTSLSGYTVTDVQFSAPSTEPFGKVIDADSEA